MAESVTEDFEQGDVVYCVPNDTPRGFAVVCDREWKPGIGTILRLHDGGTWKVCHYLNAAFCRKVGRVGPDVVETVLSIHDETAAHDAERVKRMRVS